jgi:hypothetical protein
MAGFAQAPGPLVVFGVTSTAIGGIILLLLGWHVARRLLDVPRIPLGRTTYAALVLVCTALLGTGISALMVASALDDWEPTAGGTPVAEVNCRRVTPKVTQLSFTPLDASGRRGAEEKQTLESSPCEVAVERLRFYTPLRRLGLVERLRVARVGSHRRAVATPQWRALPQPLGVPVAIASAHELSVPADDGTPYRVIADEGGGLRFEKLKAR